MVILLFKKFCKAHVNLLSDLYVKLLSIIIIFIFELLQIIQQSALFYFIFSSHHISFIYIIW